MTSQVALEGLFFHLVRQGFPLGIRDLTQALDALQAGFGNCSRENLMWLCQSLWARTEEENRRIAVLFQVLPQPTSEDIAALTGDSRKTLAEQTSSKPEDSRTSDKTNRPTAAQLDFTSSENRTGVGLPAAVTTVPPESFVLTPKPLVSHRACAIAWRRFRRPLRFGPKVDVDIEQTILTKARTGILPEPVLIPRRENRARIVLLVDVGPSMMAWRHSAGVLADSLRESQFSAFGIFYFHETPERLFEKETLTTPVPLRSAFEQFPETPVLVVSEAGAARTARDSQRTAATRECLGHFGLVWRPVAWLNPMPVSRWRNTPAQSIARLPGVSMMPFNAYGLVQAVDVLRGRR